MYAIVYLLSDYSSQSQDADDDELVYNFRNTCRVFSNIYYCPQSEAVLPSLRRSTSQPHIVDGLSEASQPYSEHQSHPIGYTDPQIAYKQMQRYKKVILI